VSPSLRTLLYASLLAFPAAPACAQTHPPPASAAPLFLKVNAPYAQKLVMETMKSHPEIKKIGLHTVPPGETESCIVASPFASKIGKISSAADLTVVTSGEPKVYPHPEEGGFFDLGLPMKDAHGQAFGLLVLEIPYRDAPSKEQALQMGLNIRDELAAKIPGKSALFSPAP